MSEVKRYFAMDKDLESGWVATDLLDAGRYVVFAADHDAAIAALEARVDEAQKAAVVLSRNLGTAEAERDELRDYFDNDENSDAWRACQSRIASLEARNEALRAALTLTHSILATIINAGLTFDGGVGGKFIGEIRDAESKGRAALANEKAGPSSVDRGGEHD